MSHDIKPPELDKTEQLLKPSLRDELMEISQRCASLPDIDKRSPEQILGYTEVL